MNKDKEPNRQEEQYTDTGQDSSVKDQVEEMLEDAIDEVNGEQDAQDGPLEREQLKDDLEKEKDKFLRLFAEFENYKRRTSKERVEMFKTANQEVVTAMLPVLDDFDRALNEINKAKDKNLLKGVELIHNKLKETLKSKGLEAMDIKQGEAFDPELHEAITQVPAPSDKLKGKIVDVLERGYKLGDRIIRFPKVVIGH